LAEGFEDGDADGVRQVERAHGAERGDADDAVLVRFEELIGEADALLAEDERVPGLKGRIEVALVRDRAEEVKAP
jgi:hypothetical protein